MSVVINPKYPHLKEFADRLYSAGMLGCNDNCTVLHDGRNSIKLYETNGEKIVVKRFGRLSLLNRIIYGRLRKSKARRAFEYAAKLKSLGIETPEEVAYIEKRDNGLMSESYYICLYTDYISMLPFFYKRTLSAVEFADITPLLDALAAFLFRVHEAGVIHNDLNYTNILYKKTEQPGKQEYDKDSYRFTLIDINRMKFGKRLSLEERMHNLRRLNVSVPAHLYILQKYAELMGEKPQTLQMMVLNMRYRFEYKRERTARIKAFLRGQKQNRQ